MTESQLIFDIREAIKQTTDDSNISDRYIMYLWNLKRSKYLRQDLNNLQKTIDNSTLQEFCLEMIEASASDCNVSYDCGTIMKSKVPIPKPLELHLRSAITKVKPTTKTAQPFNFIDKSRAILSQYSPFSGSIYAYLDSDSHIYLVSTSITVKLIDCLTVAGIFESPEQLRNFKNCCGCTTSVCYDGAISEYPLPAHHVDAIRLEIIQTLGVTLSLPEDNINNSNDDSENTNRRKN